MIQHRCTANDGGLAIVYTGKDWRLNGVQDWAIHHCPYCGLKLKPLEEEEEFDAKAFGEADAVFRQMCKLYARGLSEYTDRLFMGEEPEPPKPSPKKGCYSCGKAANCHAGRHCWDWTATKPEPPATIDKFWKQATHSLFEQIDRLMMGEEPEPPTRIHRAYWQCLGCGALNTYETDASQSQCLTCCQPRDIAGVNYKDIKMGDFWYQIAIAYTND